VGGLGRSLLLTKKTDTHNAKITLGDYMVQTLIHMSEQPVTNMAASLSILVVDDDELNRQMMRLILKREGHLAECVTNGAEALAAVKSRRFDMILMDLQMPVMDGIEASRRIREWENGDGHSFIVALTASYLPEKGAELFEAGIDNYLSKPFEVAHLRNMLQHTLENRKSDSFSEMGAPSSEFPASDVELDLQVGIHRVGGDSAVYNDLLSDFIGELPDKLERLWSYYRDRDGDGLFRAAHNLKGVSASLGALQMSAQAQRLEKQVTQGYTESIEALLNDVSATISKFRETAANYLAAVK
jgi:CheY-like chemotaxis protein/HPt (histidine-containing phosphotransfer) domain-containing protein